MEENTMFETIPMDAVDESLFDAPAKPKRSPLIWFALAFVLMVAMAGAAFVGGQMLTSQFGMRLPGLNPMGMVGGPGGGAVAVSAELQMTPAPEIPARMADLSGMYVSRDGNNITLQEVSAGPITNTGPDSMAQGPEIEVVVTNDTEIYRDVTQPPPFDRSQSDQKLVITQMVELMENADEIGANFMVQVWGERRGDRIIAQTILYMQPMMISIDSGVGQPPVEP